MGRSKAPSQLSAAFSGHSCNAKEFRTTICPNVGSRIWAVSVLLIGGKEVWRLLGWRTMVQQNLGNVQPGQMCSDTRVAESPKKVTNRSKAFAVYGSPTPYTLMEVATSVVQPYEPSSQSQLSRTKVGPPTMSLNFRVSTYIAAKHSGISRANGSL